MRGRYVQKVDLGGIWSVSGRRFDNVNVFYCACTHIWVLVECWHLTEAHRSLSTQMEYSKNRKLLIYFTQHNDTRACACAITIDDDDDVCVCVCACVWLWWVIVINCKIWECALIRLWVEVGSGGAMLYPGKRRRQKPWGMSAQNTDFLKEFTRFCGILQAIIFHDTMSTNTHQSNTPFSGA